MEEQFNAGMPHREPGTASAGQWKDAADHVLRFRNGNQKVLADLYATFAPVVHAFLRGRLRSAADARDLTQETFLIAFREETRRRYAGDSSMRGFLLGIADNLVLHHFRAIRRRAEDGQRPSADASAPVVDAEMEDRETHRILGEFMAELSVPERHFFKTHMMERPSRQLTATRLGLTVEQVRYQERKLQIRAVAYLQRIGYLEAAEPKVRSAAARAEAAWLGV